MQRHASRKDFSYECAGAWNAFGQLPGVHLWWWGTGEERYQLRTAKEEAIAFMRNVERDTYSEPMTASIGGRIFSLHRLTVTVSSSSPGIAEIAARYARDADGHFAEAKHCRDQPYMRIGELTDEAGTSILYVSGANGYHRAGACITFPDQRWLRFLVRGTERANAIMTAVDQAGNSVARYRITGEDFEPRQNTVEIAVRPGRQLTDDLVLVIAISAPWLGSSFPPRSENNPDCAL